MVRTPAGRGVTRLHALRARLTYTLFHPLAQAGRPRDYTFSVPIAAYMAATRGQPAAYRARLWELSERLVAPYASAHTWSFE